MKHTILLLITKTNDPVVYTTFYIFIYIGLVGILSFCNIHILNNAIVWYVTVNVCVDLDSIYFCSVLFDNDSDTAERGLLWINFSNSTNTRSLKVCYPTPSNDQWFDRFFKSLINGEHTCSYKCT